MENKNYMKEVASLLGVEMGQTFKILVPIYDDFAPSSFDFRISDKGMEINRENEWHEDNKALLGILSGKYGILRMPFKPQKGEWYWIPTIDADGNLNVTSVLWENTTYDYLVCCLGFCYRTKEGAEQNKYGFKLIVDKLEKDGIDGIKGLVLK